MNDLNLELKWQQTAREQLTEVYMMSTSGARGNISQVRQLLAMRGLMADAKGISVWIYVEFWALCSSDVSDASLWVVQISAWFGADLIHQFFSWWGQLIDVARQQKATSWDQLSDSGFYGFKLLHHGQRLFMAFLLKSWQGMTGWGLPRIATFWERRNLKKWQRGFFPVTHNSSQPDNSLQFLTETPSVPLEFRANCEVLLREPLNVVSAIN